MSHEKTTSSRRSFRRSHDKGNGKHGKGNNGRHNNGGNNQGKGYDGNKPWADRQIMAPVNRSLVASAMGGEGYTTVVRVLNRNEIGDIIVDRSIAIINLGCIEGFADKAKALGLEAMVTLLLTETGKVAQQQLIVLGCDVETLKTGLMTAVRKVYGDKHECSVGEILSSLRNITSGTVMKHGNWNDTKVAARRFLAAVLAFAFGNPWVKENFSSKAAGYEAISLYEASSIAANGFEAQTTIPSLTPTSTLVFGIFPQANGQVEKRYIGTLPLKPMVSSVNPNSIITPFIVVDRKGDSMKALIKLVVTGWMNANQMFKNASGEYFQYTPEMIAFMSTNRALFIALLAMAIASTNGNVQLATAIKDAYDTYVRAYTTLTSLVAQDYTLTKSFPTVSPSSRIATASHVVPGTNGSARSTKTSTPVLATVGAGSGSLSSFDPFAPNS